MKVSNKEIGFRIPEIHEFVDGFRYVEFNEDKVFKVGDCLDEITNYLRNGFIKVRLYSRIKLDYDK